MFEHCVSPEMNVSYILTVLLVLFFDPKGAVSAEGLRNISATNFRVKVLQ